MRKKGIVACILSMVVIFTLLAVLIVKKEPKYIMQDGVMLALTIDGSSVTSFPTSTNYRVSVSCENGNGKWLSEEWKFVVEDIAGNVKCTIDFTTRTDSDKLKSVVETKSTEVSLTNNASVTETSYRYTGKQPDNWVWFNNELWRIIGSIPVCMNADCSTKENLIKIIRSDSLGGLAFNSANSNTTWGTNTLYTLLNTKYYGKLDATGASPCLGYSTDGYALCNYTENGISSEASSYYGQMIKDVYWNVGTVSSSSTTIAASYGLETATVSSVSGKIGLMSASDYGYASGQTTVGLSSLSSYEQTNWMYGQGFEWTITPYSTSLVFRVNRNGSVYTNGAYNGSAVRPVLYLDSSVYVISGEGTKTSPYMIGM